MLDCPMDVLSDYPVRKSREQKRKFREAAQLYLTGLGYSVHEEKGSFGCRNLVIGDPEGADYLVTAHYDTCARLPVPNLLTPCHFWPFMLYQLGMASGMLLVTAMTGMLVWLLTRDVSVSVWVSYGVLWGIIVLMLAGPANPSNANDNTSGVVTVLEMARTMPENRRDKVCFVLFDLEEAGLIGSSAYRKAHKKDTDRQLVLNLDCVGDGDSLRIFPTKKLKRDRQRLSPLYQVCGTFGKKTLLVRDKGFAVYPSDQMNFPYAVGICALRSSRFGLYLGRIHTPRDTVLEETNVNLLRSALTSLICCGAAQIGKEDVKNESV